MTRTFLEAWFEDQPLTEVGLAILAIESAAGVDKDERDALIESVLGWTIPYYEENVRCLAKEKGASEFAPGLCSTLLDRYPGEPACRVFTDAEAFTRPDHL